MQETKPSSAGIQDSALLRKRLLALSVPMLLPSFAISVVSVALPVISVDFEVSLASIQWVMMAYLLTICALVVGLGRVGDYVGHRKLLGIGIGIFFVASLACGLAPSVGVLIAARAVQGVGGAAMLVLTLAMVRQAIPKSRVGAAMGVLGSMSAIGTASGPVVGGIFIDFIQWRALFWLCAAIAVLAFVMLRLLPASTPNGELALSRRQTVSMGILGLCTVFYALAISPLTGGFGALNIVLALTALIGVAAFASFERRSSSPLFVVGSEDRESLRLSLAGTAATAGTVMTALVVGPFFLSRGLLLEPAVVGLVVAAGPATNALVSTPAGWLVDYWKPKQVRGLGLALMAGGATGLASISLSWGIAGYVASLVTITGGFALFQSSNNVIILQQASAQHQGVASGLISLMRNLGLMTGASIIGSVYTSIAQSAGGHETIAGSLAGIHTSFWVVVAILLTLGCVEVIMALNASRNRPQSSGSADVAIPVKL